MTSHAAWSKLAMKPILIRQHARDRMAEYGLTEASVLRAVHTPEWTASDPRPGIERHFVHAPEIGGRALRVACVETEAHIRVLSATRTAARGRPMPVKTTYDADADALYIQLSEGRPFEGEDAGPLTLHYAGDGKVVGIEVLFARQVLAPGAWSEDPVQGGWRLLVAE